MLEERQSFHGPRDIDEVKSSISWLKSAVPTTDFGLVSEQAQVHMEKPSTLPIVNRSPLNRDMGSLMPTVPDEVNSVENRVLSSCISEAVMSCVAALAPVPLESRIMEKLTKTLLNYWGVGEKWKRGISPGTHQAI